MAVSGCPPPRGVPPFPGGGGRPQQTGAPPQNPSQAVTAFPLVVLSVFKGLAQSISSRHSNLSIHRRDRHGVPADLPHRCLVVQPSAARHLMQPSLRSACSALAVARRNAGRHEPRRVPNPLLRSTTSVKSKPSFF